MKENAQQNSLDDLNADIARTRAEFAALAAGLKQLAELEKDGTTIDAELLLKMPTKRDEHRTVWAVLWRGLRQAGVQGKKLSGGIADEMERHPLLGGVAAFGLGYALARMLFRRGK